MPNILAGPRPKTGTHALVIGVSDYPFLNDPASWLVTEGFALPQLTTAARAASDVAAWLLDEYYNPDAPLASLRVLLSPADGERINGRIKPLLDGVTSRAERDAVIEEVRAFEEDCKKDPKGMAFVYVVGHGLELTTRSALLLLSDFGDPSHLNRVSAALDVTSFHSAMNAEGKPERQIWFADACRQQADVLAKWTHLPGAISPDGGGPPVMSSTLILSATTGESAFATRTGTLFTKALLEGLRGAAGTGPEANGSTDWQIKLDELKAWLSARVGALAGQSNVDQSIDVMGRVFQTVLLRLREAPKVDLTLKLSPKGLNPLPRGTIDKEAKVIAKVTEWPDKRKVPAGLYRITVRSNPKVVRDVDVRPPKFDFTIEVAP
ncbi:hypothetical protein SAMN04487846_0780 [Microbacterium sp. cf046]|uniref:caspase family protein n=1 Tax=Microbacterium sp. cf046 TaxID=1761803 RepID=UPI0008E642BE|nr:caspase family protein [Microbacterium sp. cf046]SFR93295.1 hypothetical protein SAMN04487846_0780 [Microbacterium sp. cf046]